MKPARKAFLFPVSMTDAVPASDLPKPSAQGLKSAMILTATVLVRIDEEIAKTSATLTVGIASETENGTERETVIVIGPEIVARETTIPEMTVATRTRIATEMTDAKDGAAGAEAGADAANVIGAETAIGEIVTGIGTGTVAPDESAALMIGVTEESAVAVDREGEAEVRVSNAGTLQL